MLVKVCGLRDRGNIAAVAGCKPDFVGFVFYKPSPRYALPTLDQEGLPDVGAAIGRIGIFVNEDLKEIIRTVERFGLTGVQLHGSEDATYCRAVKSELPFVKVFKALGVRGSGELEDILRFEAAADYLLFDTKCDSVGGSGRKFEWGVLDGYRTGVPFILSGGIGPEDVAAVKDFVRGHPLCAGCDINSRFESAPGVKDIERVKTFIAEIRKP